MRGWLLGVAAFENIEKFNFFVVLPYGYGKIVSRFF